MPKTPLAAQPDRLPTNKLTAAALVAPAVTEAWGAVMAQLYPPLAGPEMSMLMGALAAVALGYVIPDRANVPQ